MPGSVEPLDTHLLQIPYHFRCPISLELMRDPVTVCTGQTYDRSSIESWVATGNTTCPVTRCPLSDFTLIPNHTLRRLIQDWCVDNRSFGVERIPTPKQPADPNTVRSLLSQVSSPSCPAVSRLSTLRRLKQLARDSDKNRSLISSLNAREVFVNLIFSENISELCREALSVIVMFQLSESECVSIASDSEKVACLTSFLFDSSMDVRVNTAAMIETVVAGTRSTEIRAQLSNVEEIFHGIVEILKDSMSNPRSLKVAVKALFALCLVKQTRHKAVAAGAAAVLIDRMSDFDKCDAERALATVELLCRVPAGCVALSANELTVPLLVRMILKVSERATEYAAGALVGLCTASEESRRAAVAAGVVTQMLLLVQSGCTDRGKRKAQVLLKLLRDSWPRESCFGNSDDFVCSEVVPF